MKTAYPSVASNQGMISISWPPPIRKCGRVGICRQGSVAYGRGRYGTRVFRTVPSRGCLSACSRRAAVERLQSCPLRNTLDLSASSKSMHVSANLNLYLNRTVYHLFAWNGVGHMLCLPNSFSKAPGLPRERPHPAYRVTKSGHAFTKSGHALLKHRCMIRVKALRHSTRIFVDPDGCGCRVHDTHMVYQAIESRVPGTCVRGSPRPSRMPVFLPNRSGSKRTIVPSMSSAVPIQTQFTNGLM